MTTRSTFSRSEVTFVVSATSQPPINEIFQQHLEEVSFWQLVADATAAELWNVIRHERISGKVEARAKTTGSVIGKAYRRPDTHSTLAAFGDLAGARVLVPFASDVEPVARELSEHPDFTVLKDEVKIRKPEELRYQARHLDVGLGSAFDLVPPMGFGTRLICCEVQIQTFAQSLWASVSHLVTYKRELPDDVRRRVNRLVALCEIFDDEATQSRILALENVDAVGLIAEQLQMYFFGVTGEIHDPDQAVALVARLLPTLDDSEQAGYADLLESFVHEHGARLRQLLTDRPEARGLHWLLRPEVILILERLTRKPARLTEVWIQEFPEADLNALAAAWGPLNLA